MGDSEQLLDVLGRAKVLAREYYKLTGRPFECTGEIAEYEAARLLGLELAPVRQSGYDAVLRTPDGTRRLQIKGRSVLPHSRPGQRIGRIDRTNPEWDAVLLVLLDEHFDATAIYEADRDAVVAALVAPGRDASE